MSRVFKNEDDVLNKVLKAVRDSENKRNNEINGDDIETTDEYEDPIDENETYVLTEKMCFCAALYDACLFNEYDFFGDLFYDKAVSKAWDLFEHRLIQNGLYCKEQQPKPKSSVNALDVLKSVLRDTRIADREDYRGDETAETVLDFFEIMLKRQGYNVS